MFLSKDEIAAWTTPSVTGTGVDLRTPLRNALSEHGQLSEGQTAGRFYPMACVALEITQRCNLDCTLCYLSDHAEMAHDIPLPVLFRRIDAVADHYGEATTIQITGGDPTLRSPEHLEQLCRYIRGKKLRSCLMTNGIKASEALLKRLAAAGLDDVAFHVDLTQERRGYPTEVSLNEFRESYIARGRSAGLRILFNTTVFGGNVEELPEIAAFFKSQAEHVTMASFQMEAMTGRGVVRDRTTGLTRDRIEKLLDRGFGTKLNFDVAAIGHGDCTRFGTLLVAGDQGVTALDNNSLFAELLAHLEKYDLRDRPTMRIAPALLRALGRHPVFALRVLGFLTSRLWHLRRGLVASRGRVHRMSVLLHNFMDAKQLEQDRCASCVFMVATERGPVSMCVHNARRDAELFAPVRMDTKDGPQWWSAKTGRVGPTPEFGLPVTTPFKKLKGHLRSQANDERKKG